MLDFREKPEMARDSQKPTFLGKEYPKQKLRAQLKEVITETNEETEEGLDESKPKLPNIKIFEDRRGQMAKNRDLSTTNNMDNTKSTALTRTKGDKRQLLRNDSKKRVTPRNDVFRRLYAESKKYKTSRTLPPKFNLFTGKQKSLGDEPCKILRPRADSLDKISGNKHSEKRQQKQKPVTKVLFQMFRLEKLLGIYKMKVEGDLHCRAGASANPMSIIKQKLKPVPAPKHPPKSVREHSFPAKSLLTKHSKSKSTASGGTQSKSLYKAVYNAHFSSEVKEDKLYFNRLKRMGTKLVR